nr:IS200/IS605 family element transposase accessory protein TnpB [bacterium]
DNKMGSEDRGPIIINGKPIKSINQFYNKKRAEIQMVICGDKPACAELSINGKRTSKELVKITDWRNEKILDYMHKTSRFVINHCLEHNLGHIVIGKNDGWKQEINIGKRNNQNFVSIPFDKLIQQIQYKAQLVGIKVTKVCENYTSKCSALDLEVIGKHENHAYAGKRVKRGLFRTALGLLINADVNGALNILRKVIGDNFLKPFIQKVVPLKRDSGYLCYPFKVCF